MSFHPFRALAFGLLSRITQEVHLLDQLTKGIGSLVFPLHTTKKN